MTASIRLAAGLEKPSAQTRWTRLLSVFVLITSKEHRDIIISYQFGAASYICKPVSFGEFVKAAGQLGLYWLLINELPNPMGNGGVNDAMFNDQ